MPKYEVFVNLKGIICIEAESEEEAICKALYSGNEDVSWDEWFSIDDAQVTDE